MAFHRYWTVGLCFEWILCAVFADQSDLLLLLLLAASTLSVQFARWSVLSVPVPPASRRSASLVWFGLVHQTASNMLIMYWMHTQCAVSPPANPPSTACGDGWRPVDPHRCWLLQSACVLNGSCVQLFAGQTACDVLNAGCGVCSFPSSWLSDRLPMMCWMQAVCSFTSSWLSDRLLMMCW